MSNNLGLNVCDVNAKLFSDLSKELLKDKGVEKLRTLAEELCGIPLNTDPRPSRSVSETLLLLLGDFGCDVGTLAYLLEKCELWNALALIKTEPLQLEEDVHTDEIWVALGGCFQLSCKATGFPPPKYVWEKDGTEVENGASSELLIESVRSSDGGTYQCIITQLGVSGPSIATKQVHIKIIPQKPTITSQPHLSETTVRKIEIGATGYPEPVFQWHRDGRPIKQRSQDAVYELSIESDLEGGIYSCFLTNSEGSVWSDEIEVNPYSSFLKDTQFLARDKIALLIGNSNYRSHPHLLSSHHDVITLAEHLDDLSFRIVALRNLTLVEMKNAINMVAQNTAEGSYVLVYYGGHGFSFYGNDYLLPVDAPPNGAYKCSDSLDKEEVVSYFSHAKPRLLTVLLDMCRKTPTEEENPFLHSERPKIYRYEPQRNLIFGFATTTNLSAFELSNEKNGIFMKYLKKHIQRKIPVRQLLAEVQAEILREPSAAAQLQMPSVTNNLAEDVSLADGLEYRCVSNVENFWKEINTLPETQNYSWKGGGRLRAQFWKGSDYYLNSLEIRIECEKIKDDLGLRSSSEDVVLNTEILESVDNRVSCRVTVDDIQKLKGPFDISVYLSGNSETDLKPVSTIHVGLPLISCLQLSTNKL